MKIGVFDSGMGGYTIVKSIRKLMPEYDYMYLADTLNVPYGQRSLEDILALTERGVGHLFEQGCQIVIIACNTASVRALKIIQNGFLKMHYPDRRVLGVVIPTVETAIELGAKSIGLLATPVTVRSNVYEEELSKINQSVRLIGCEAPNLVPLIESGNYKEIEAILPNYLNNFRNDVIDVLILGCTHYSILKTLIKRSQNDDIKIISQDEVIPEKLKQYLIKHQRMEKLLSRNGTLSLFATSVTKNYDGFQETDMVESRLYKANA